MAAAKKTGSAPEKLEVTKSPGGRLVQLGKLDGLPIGKLQADGTLAKDIATRAWKTRDERELGKLRKKDTSPARYISLIIRQICSVVGDYRAEDYKQDDSKELEKSLIKLGQLPSGDVFYAYIKVRIAALGEKIDFKVKCRSCAGTFVFSGDLNTIDCKCADTPADLTWEYILRDGAEIRGKQIKKFAIGQPRWSLFEDMLNRKNNAENVNQTQLKFETLRSTIVGLDDDTTQVQLAPQELDDISKFDYENMIAQFDERSLGPSMKIDGECPHCQANFAHQIDWTNDDFFGISSRS